MLAQAPAGLCLTCKTSFNSTKSTAKLPQSFCSKNCKGMFILQRLENVGLGEVYQILERLELLLEGLSPL